MVSEAVNVESAVYRVGYESPSQFSQWLSNSAIVRSLRISLDNPSLYGYGLGVKPAHANQVFRALADPTRRAIFEELSRQGEQTVHALTRYAGVSQPAVSKHLTVLKRAKLVRHRREGRETHYRARPDALAPMVDWLRHYGAFWRDRFDRLEALLERMES